MVKTLIQRKTIHEIKSSQEISLNHTHVKPGSERLDGAFWKEVDIGYVG